MKLAMKHMRPVLDYRVKKTKWCVLRWPSASMAQQAGMSTEAFEDFYFRVCLLDYKALVPAMTALKKLMDQTDRVEITGPGTDLRFSIKGIPALFSGGNYNIPDGEVFTSPVRDSVEGLHHLQRAHHLSGHSVRRHPPGIRQRQDHQGRGRRENQTAQQDPR